MASDRRVPEFKITQSTSVTLCMISVTKFPTVGRNQKETNVLSMATPKGICIWKGP